MHIRCIAGAVVISLTVAGGAVAASSLSKPKGLAIMHERHEGMEAIGKANKVLHRELVAESPNLGAVRAAAAQIVVLSRRASGWFPVGTGPELGKTGAKPEIWRNPRDFAIKLRDFQNQARAFNSAAASKDVQLIKTQYGDLGHSCKACHDTYRSEMKH